MYYNGNGVSQSHVTTAKWTKLAAEQGHASAQNNIGLMYKSGRGVAQDYTEEVRWLTLPAEQAEAKKHKVICAICMTAAMA